MNQQREVIYTRRRHALRGERLRDDIFFMLKDFIDQVVDKYYDEARIEELRDELRTKILVDYKVDTQRWQDMGKDGVKEDIYKTATDFYKRKEKQISVENLAMLEKMVTLQVIDEKWKDHLREMDDLKEGIHLRAYGQKDPLIEYKTEAFGMFSELLNLIMQDTVQLVFKLYPSTAEALPARRARAPRQEEMQLTHQEAFGMGLSTPAPQEGNREPVSPEEAQRGGGQRQVKKIQPIKVGDKVGRNDPCPCGSGKKYKQCHGQ
jgi:preprotein translocase subunit SecA